MKGIIDFEIAKKRNKKEFYIPVFYSSPSRVLASGDAVFNTDYLGSAEEAKNNTIKYLKENNVSATSEKIDGELKVSFVTDDFFYKTKAYKLKY